MKLRSSAEVAAVGSLFAGEPIVKVLSKLWPYVSSPAPVEIAA